MREIRDPELTMHSNRRAYILPRQIAMYIARQLTGASLQDLGRQFGGRHGSMPVVVTDLNNDTRLDIVVGNPYAPGIRPIAA
jgi:DnaA-like protein/FG-GAP repeat protein